MKWLQVKSNCFSTPQITAAVEDNMMENMVVSAHSPVERSNKRRK